MDEEEQPVGVLIRRLRRQHNLTQIQLGGKSYSKSYVSALEHGKLSPSQRALRFFAGQLELPEDYFITLVERAESRQQLVMAGENSPPAPGNELWLSSEERQMLDALLGHVHNYNAQALLEFPAVSLEQISTTPSSRQAGYAYILGMSAQQNGEYDTALRALEYALALAPPQLRPAILDALGDTHARQNRRTLALHYHLRAYRLLKEASLDGASLPLHLSIALHCGDDYCALGVYQQASSMYDEARSYLSAEQTMQTAARIFLGLGYSLYGLLSQQRLSTSAHQTRLSPEEREHFFQRSISLLLQSRSLYQVSGESTEEIEALLTLTQVELDLSYEHYQSLSRQTGSANRLLEASCSSLLSDVEEQCHQVLLFWQGKAAGNYAAPERRAPLIFVALASLVRVHLQRARIARAGGHKDTARRERILASSLCQEVLDALGNPSSLERLTQWLSLQNDLLYSRDPVLPPMPGRQAAFSGDNTARGRVELYLAAGEVAEELGQATTDPDFPHDCRTRADAFYVAALEHAFPLVIRRAQDPGYLIRCYQRCLNLLDERAAGDQDSEEETAAVLRALLKTGLSLLPDALMPGESS
jgi:transcriptional regulator with XRE-family HTH domain